MDIMLILGTSGWNYGHWNEKFYPKGLAPREQLTFLARHFDSVELNASFYRLPPESNFAKWYGDTPPNFRFSVKIPRTITHLKRLHGAEEDFATLLERVTPLGEKLSVFLAQFPPSFSASEVNVARMEAFLDLVAAAKVRMAYELRHPTWFEEVVLQMFMRHGVCLVQAESSRFPHTPAGFAPADYTYYRFHGPRALYSSQYREEELRYWAALIERDMMTGKDVYVYFDNDVNGYALEDARRLRLLVLGSAG